MGQEVQRLAVQGSVARGGEALLISFRIGGSGRLETPDQADREALLQIAQEAGGGEYLVGLRRFEGGPRREELLQRKKEVDPKGILEAPR